MSDHFDAEFWRTWTATVEENGLEGFDFNTFQPAECGLWMPSDPAFGFEPPLQQQQQQQQQDDVSSAGPFDNPTFENGFLPTFHAVTEGVQQQCLDNQSQRLGSSNWMLQSDMASQLVEHPIQSCSPQAQFMQASDSPTMTAGQLDVIPSPSTDRDPLRVMNGRRICDWPDCNESFTWCSDYCKQSGRQYCVGSYYFQRPYNRHLTSHLPDLPPERWISGVLCHWPKCSSKRNFSSPKKLKLHFENLHTGRFTCRVPKCKQKPFEKHSDLKRHIKSKHRETALLCCSVSDCERSTNGFTRKDKLVKHMKETHASFRCELNHCGKIVYEGQLDRHTEESHGDVECALTSCSLTSSSKFNFDGLAVHLRKEHKISYDRLWHVTYRVDNLRITTFTEDHLLLRSGSRFTVEDCLHCSKRVGATQDNAANQASNEPLKNPDAPLT